MGGNETRDKMRYFLFDAEFSVCPVEKQVSSVYGMKSKLCLSTALHDFKMVVTFSSTNTPFNHFCYASVLTRDSKSLLTLL